MRTLGQRVGVDGLEEGDRRLIDGEILAFMGIFVGHEGEIYSRWCTAGDTCNGREVVNLLLGSRENHSWGDVARWLNSGARTGSTTDAPRSR